MKKENNNKEKSQDEIKKGTNETKVENNEKIETNNNNKTVKVKRTTRKRTIIVLAFLVVALIALYVYVRGSYLEFKAIGENYIPVFWRNITYTFITFAINFIFLYSAFYFTNRSLKKGLKVFFDDEKKEMPKFPNKSVSFIIALIGSVATTKMLLNSILLCFSNSQFGSTDLVFGLDISYFMFQRPFIIFILSYLMVVTIATIIYAVIYAIIVLNMSFDGVERESIKKVDLVSKLGSRIKLLAVLFGLFIFVYMVQNIGNEKFLTIELSDATQYSLFGAGNSDVTIKLWGYVIFAILVVISILRAYKSLKDKSTRRVLGNLLIVPVYLIILAVVLAGYQLIFIGSNVLDKNQEYIAENIKQTKNAFGINVEENNIDFSGTITKEELNKEQNVIDNISIVNSSNVLQDLQSSQTEKGYYTYRSTQIELYNINNKPTLVYVSPREIDSSNTTYSNKTYEYTHGYGAVITMAGKTDEEGNLKNVQKDFGDLSNSMISTTEPRIYFGLETNSAVVVNEDENTEFDYTNDDGAEENYSYTGNAGLTLNFLDRIILGIKEGDLQLAFSGNVDRNSKIIINRNILERAKIIMPYLTYDENPYLVIDDLGNQYWVIDAYTISNSYPFSQQLDLEDGQKMNYIRNSVKVIVNAFDGTMKFYITDRTDPIVMAYNNMYPGLFESKDEKIPEDISKHFVYPKYLYDIQAEVMQKYHNIQPEVLYRGNDIWKIAESNNTGKTTKMESYYTMVKPAGSENETLGLVIPFTPYGKQNMISYMVGTYENGEAKLKVYEFPSDSNVLGPMQIETQINQDGTMSTDIASLNVSGTKITKNLIAVPINNTILYVEPIYQQLLNETTEQKPTLKRLIVASGNKIAIGNNLDEALTNLLSQSAGNIEIPNPDNVDDLINEIIKANNNVKNSSSNNDWKLFGEDMQTLTSLIDELDNAVKEKQAENQVNNENTVSNELVTENNVE